MEVVLQCSGGGYFTRILEDTNDMSGRRNLPFSPGKSYNLMCFVDTYLKVSHSVKTNSKYMCVVVY